MCLLQGRGAPIDPLPRLGPTSLCILHSDGSWTQTPPQPHPSKAFYPVQRDRAAVALPPPGHQGAPGQQEVLQVSISMITEAAGATRKPRLEKGAVLPGRSEVTPSAAGPCGGTAMGAHLVRRYLGDASVEPDPLQMPTFSPDYGYPDRKERGTRSTDSNSQSGHLRRDTGSVCGELSPGETGEPADQRVRGGYGVGAAKAGFRRQRQGGA
ncbi:NADH dehydrogenase [ubiquinone] 1 beta subcomplex subunit 7 isoform X2 [Fukomys damarensis]|uniref:NADH dehydrogenase [ubiquinone] 1 beta subcomplex subunit 7 isoform X2 n=1 Tax=Fukomys damarensis TaxID=885580 RepID=UPI001454EFD2|nr:NADH dehydrogenase [ubiquinone] 1 beta subcomplex subunit 7 isoform X2 [Fukomys damarensis]